MMVKSNIGITINNLFIQNVQSFVYRTFYNVENIHQINALERLLDVIIRFKTICVAIDDILPFLTQ